MDNTHFVGDDCPGGHRTPDFGAVRDFLRLKQEATLASHTDIGKCLVNDLDPQFLWEMGGIMSYGLTKYVNDADGMPNWWKGGNYRSFVGSILRHAIALAAGEDFDDCPQLGPSGSRCLGADADYCPEHSRKAHAAHLAIDSMFVRSWQRRGVGEDNRLV